jgi:hypothetical protein
MGNFSRNTFDSAKRYTAVRLQQGVPLVDADWNELQDVTRNELYDSLLTVMPNVLQPSMLLTGVGNNDLQLNTGIAIVSGRPAKLNTPLRYSTQRYANPATAAADGVPVAAPLTTPGSNRTDLVFLDVFEREVGSAEDGSIVNPAIGVETAVRLRRELVLRVGEGGVAPSMPPGHAVLFIATLQRQAGVAAITQDMIDDIAPRNPAAPFEDIVVPPMLFPVFAGNIQLATSWLTSFIGNNLVAFKPANVGASGFAPVYIPNTARVRSMRVRGQNNGTGTVMFQLLRNRLDTGLQATVVQDVVNTQGPFDRTLVVNQAAGLGVINNQQFSYYIQAGAGSSAGDVQITGFSLRYNVG